MKLNAIFLSMRRKITLDILLFSSSNNEISEKGASTFKQVKFPSSIETFYFNNRFVWMIIKYNIIKM